MTAKNIAGSYKVDTALIERLAREVLKKIPKSRGLELEIIFVDDREIKKLNRRFTGRPGPTDVLSFGLGGVGSIAISLDTASRNAKTFGTPFHEEAVRYVIHGILHLSGYDDDTVSNRRKMSAKEDVILESICSSTDLSKVLTRR